MIKLDTFVKIVITLFFFFYIKGMLYGKRSVLKTFMFSVSFLR